MGEFILIPKEKVDEIKIEGSLLLEELEIEYLSLLKLEIFFSEIFKVLDGEF